MKTKKVDYLSYIICYALCVVLSKAGYSYPAGVVLMGEALFLYVLSVKRSGVLTDLRGLFSASWIGGEGLACLQLSRLQQDWENTTWLCFFFGYLFFMAGYDLLEQRFADGNGANGKGKQQLPHAEKTDWKRDQGKKPAHFDLHRSVDVRIYCLFSSGSGSSRFHPAVFSGTACVLLILMYRGFTILRSAGILIPALSVLYFRLVEKWNPAGLILLIRRRDGGRNSDPVCVQISAFVCGWICCSRLSDGLPPCYMEDDRDGIVNPDFGLCTSDGGEKT